MTAYCCPRMVVTQRLPAGEAGWLDSGLARHCVDSPACQRESEAASALQWLGIITCRSWK